MASGLAPVRSAPETFADKLVVVDASNQGQPRGNALPLLMDLAYLKGLDDEPLP